MKSINNYKTFLITVLLVLGTVYQAINAQNAAWRYATVLPGSTIKATLRPVFSDCYTVETYFQKDWYNCKDTKGLHKMNWNSVWNKVHKEADFTITKSGYLYIRFDSKIPKDVFYYGKPTIAISKMGKDKKWHSVWIGGSVYTPIQKQQYRISPDGTLKYYGIPPHYEAGQYKVTVVSATRNNPNKAERVFVPSSANAKVYFVADGSKVTIPKPKVDNKFTFSKKWHVNETIKIGLARVVNYLRRRANELSKTKPAMAALFRTYADRIIDADFYYDDSPMGSGEASTWFGNITLYSQFKTNPIFGGKDHQCEDADLGEGASAIMHEIAHKYGAFEWDAHYLQKLTFDDLKVPKYIMVDYEKVPQRTRTDNKKFFKVYPVKTIWAQFYRWTVK